MRKLDLSKCKTNEEVCELVRDRVTSIPYEDLQTHVSKRFVFLEEATKAVWTGLAMNMNVFLSGPGGYGKTTLIKYILDFYKIPYHTVVGYKDMPVDALLGIPNMPKLLKDSEYELNFKNSVFYKPGILIGEEFTDILPSTAAALKDILTEKGFRNKGAFVPSRIATMIVAANKHPREIADDESKKAFYNERFPVKQEVVWNSFEAVDYFSMLEGTFPDANKALLYFTSKLFETNHAKFNNTVSPRTAIAITDVYLKQGIEFISHFDINLTDVDSVGRIANMEFNKKTIGEILKDIIDLVREDDHGDQRKSRILYAIRAISNLEIPAEAVDVRNNALKTLDSMFINERARLSDKRYNRIDNILEKL